MIVKNGLLALPGQSEFVRAEFRVSEGRIVEIAQRIEGASGEEIADASGLLVLPGGIDPHVHFDEPGFTHREDFFHGTSEAAKGGVTTVIDMPCTSLPPVTTITALESKLAVVSKGAVVDYAFYGGVSGHEIEASLGSGGAMADLAPRVVGFKCYFISGMASFTSVNHDDFARVVAEGERLGRPILLHAEDRDYVVSVDARLTAARKASGASPSWVDYLAPRSREAELTAVATALALAKGRESGLHIVHVSTPEAAAMIAAAGATCETCAHYLAFDENDFERLGASLKTAPPVKSRADREGLWQRLADGTLSFVTSDHAPAPASEKETGDPLTAYGGIPGTGTWLPFLFSEGLLSGRLTLARFLDAIAGSAARRYGLAARKGGLAVGKDADFVLIDPAATTKIEGRKLLSKGKITPFEGMRLTGRILVTYVRGVPVYRAVRGADENAVGDIVAPAGSGKFLTWGYR
ncbi:MAG: amidohydrolase family protein [Actinomycetota bacterium]